MDRIQNGWFSEINEDLWPGQSISLRVEKILHQEKSDFQQILVLQTKNHGRALILDGLTQCTEHDEFAYQEMISFLPLCAHPNPSTVLIIGGGDGGVARECHKHPKVTKIIQVEIDPNVISVSQKYLPFMSKGLSSDKLTLHVSDGFEFLQRHRNEFDVIITDSSDPIGPAVSLFTESYFELLKSALKDGGVISTQCGNVWTELDHIKTTMSHCRKHFSCVKYAVASVPTYPSGIIGFIVAGDSEVAIPKFKIDTEMKYYNSEIHSASFVLPSFVHRGLYE